METQNVTCVLCEKQTPLSKSVEDCETGRPVCYSCNETEFDQWQAGQTSAALKAKFNRLTKRLATVLQDMHLLCAMNDAPVEVTTLFSAAVEEENSIATLIANTLAVHPFLED